MHLNRPHLWLVLTLLLAACNSNLTQPAPAGLTATPGEGQVTLKWQDKSSFETGYSVYRQAVTDPTGASTQRAGALEQIASTPANVTEYVDETILPNTLYRYGVSTKGKWGSKIVTTTLQEPVPEDIPTPTNRAPSAQAQAVSTEEDTPVTFTLSGSDPDGDDLSYAIVDEPDHGTLSGDAPSLTYTPDENYNGQDSFTYTVSDGQLTSEPATVTLTIGDVGDPPTGLSLDSTKVEENQPVGTVVGTLGATDADSTSFTYSLPEGEADNASFIIEDDQLKTAESFDFETKSEYTVLVEVSDGELSYRESFDITVGDVEEADKVNPSMTFENPDTLLKDKQVILSGTASDNVGVSSVTLYEVKGEAETELGEITPSGRTWTYSYTPQATGKYTLKAVAVDAAKNEAEQSVNVMVGDAIVGNTNDNGPDSLRQTVIDASAGDTIVFAESLRGQSINLTAQSPIALNKDLTILGFGKDELTIDGKGSLIFSSYINSKLLLQGMTLTNGFNDNGGAISSGSELTLDDVSVQNNRAFDQGGGIQNNGSLILRNGSDVSNNEAGSGGGIYNEPEAILILEDTSSVRDNTATQRGGGVLNYGTLTLQDSSSISGNTANEAAGLYAEFAPEVTLRDNASVTKNSATNDGGGIYVEYTPLKLMGNASVTNNSAGGRAGGILIGVAWVVIDDNATVAANTAQSGGGIYLKTVGNDLLTLQGSASISSNTANEDGGGVYSNRGSFTLEDSSTITENRADSDGDGNGTGGGVFLFGGTIRGADYAGSDVNNDGVYNIFDNVRGTTANEIPDNVSP